MATSVLRSKFFDKKTYDRSNNSTGTYSYFTCHLNKSMSILYLIGQVSIKLICFNKVPFYFFFKKILFSLKSGQFFSLQFFPTESLWYSADIQNDYEEAYYRSKFTLLAAASDWAYSVAKRTKVNFPSKNLLSIS